MAPGDQLSLWAAFASLIPVLFGGIAAGMRLFVEPVKEFRRRADFIEKRLLESIAVRLSSLLNHARRIEDDSVLRGDGHIEPDLVSDYTESVFKLFRMVHRLELLRLTIRWCFNVLLATALLGAGGAVIGIIWAETRPYIVYFAGLIVAIQCIAIVVNYTSANQLEQYEDIS